jgi:threonine dehydratase
MTSSPTWTRRLENYKAPIALEEIQAARQRLSKVALHTHLVRLNIDDPRADIFLKLENLQPVGSFKLRGAANALLLATQDELRDGVWTASAGNMALALAWQAHSMGVSCTAVVPEEVPPAKLHPLERLGAKALKVPFTDYQQIQREHRYDGMGGLLIHPFADRVVMAGNGVIGLEILEDLPELETLIIPYGGGGLSCGIGSAVRAVKPGVRILAAEAATAAPLSASLAAGRPVKVNYTPSFISGIGAPFVFEEMWPLASALLDGGIVVPLAEVRQAMRIMGEHNHIITEGAGAVATAAALTGKAGNGKIACIVSGGNIDRSVFAKILHTEAT